MSLTHIRNVPNFETSIRIGLLLFPPSIQLVYILPPGSSMKVTVFQLFDINDGSVIQIINQVQTKDVCRIEGLYS